jgi:hypothetical protein
MKIEGVQGLGRAVAQALLISSIWTRRQRMEQRDLEIINRNMENDSKLRALYMEHLDFERKLDRFKNKIHLTPQEEMEKKQIQKMKLRGRDLIEEILAGYRKRGS